MISYHITSTVSSGGGVAHSSELKTLRAGTLYINPNRIRVILVGLFISYFILLLDVSPLTVIKVGWAATSH